MEMSVPKLTFPWLHHGIETGTGIECPENVTGVQLEFVGQLIYCRKIKIKTSMNCNVNHASDLFPVRKPNYETRQMYSAIGINTKVFLEYFLVPDTLQSSISKDANHKI